MTKEVPDRDLDYVNEKEVLNKIYDYLIKSYKLEDDFKKTLEVSG